MQAKYFVLLREPSDLLPYLTFMVFVGFYGGKAAVVPWPKLPASARSHTLSYYFLTGCDGKQANWLFPKFKQENLANADTSFLMPSRFASM